MELKDLKPGDSIWNVTFDRFIKCTIKEISVRKYKKSIIGANEFEITHIITEEGDNVFKDSYYRDTNDCWFASLEQANNKKDYFIKYHLKQIDSHTRDLRKLTHNII